MFTVMLNVPGLMHGYWLWPSRHDGSLASLTAAGSFLRAVVGEAIEN